MRLKLNHLFLFLIFFLSLSCTKKETMYCGFDDGPFSAIETELLADETRSKVFELNNQGTLMIDNQLDSLSPILSLYEEGQLKWSILMELENWHVDSIYHINMTGDKKIIKLSFFAAWSFGHESGNMRIDRSNGDNNYCLSW